MKIKFLGTAAAEGCPGVFCNCEYCSEARHLGGKNIRTRSQTLINDDLLIDLPADTYSHFLCNGIEGDKIANLLITHNHGDHFYPEELQHRGVPYAHNMRVPMLDVFCGEKVYQELEGFLDDCTEVSVHQLKPFEEVNVGNYRVTPLTARHNPANGGGLIYIIREDDKTILYAHDTGYFFDEVFEYIENNKIFFDFVTLDCTCVNIPTSDNDVHMGIENNLRLVKKLKEIGAVNDKTIKVINHFSHNGGPIQHKLENQVGKHGFLVAYDGFTVEIE
ncbi:MAG: hypothetical protein E7412_00415 [Ruminococcaceae bacterium]|nr:hypothetical protein [Oscillospiraceae bacterium]